MLKFILLFCVSLLLVILVSFKNNKINLTGVIKDKNFESPKGNEFNFLLSKGLNIKDDYVLSDTESCNFNMVKEQLHKDIIWIRTTSKSKNSICDLDIFSQNLDKLTKPVILVTGDGDKSIPSDLKEETYNRIIEHDKIKIWYTQNYDGTVDNQKLKHYPIGFNLHTERTLFGIALPFLPKNPVTGKINYLLKIRNNFSDKENKIFCDVHLSQKKRFNNERSRVKRILQNCKNVNFLNFRTNQYNIWKKYSSYKFVISTFGNGLDCYRTWEILFLGSIVITKTSSLDPLFKDLPVVIVKDWDECLDTNNLKKWEEKYSPLTNYDYINKFYKYNHWITDY